MFKDTQEATYKDQLLYVHQEKWQRDLLLKYGGEICLLDATYKTTKYAVPLFFLCVKTNSGYAVVGDETKKRKSKWDISAAPTVLPDVSKKIKQ
ncbi:hypothetical protein AC249_AIPGENE21615 [Exaiptasia diaphana]|nr:hypothetical protein AC249_AIPGENE21615 [Exaiptasia diaphana]